MSELKLAHETLRQTYERDSKRHLDDLLQATAERSKVAGKLATTREQIGKLNSTIARLRLEKQMRDELLARQRKASSEMRVTLPTETAPGNSQRRNRFTLKQLNIERTENARLTATLSKLTTNISELRIERDALASSAKDATTEVESLRTQLRSREAELEAMSKDLEVRRGGTRRLQN